MNKQLAKMRRLVKVQNDLVRLEEGKLASLRRQELEARRAEEELVGALNGDAPLHGLFVEATARRLRSLAGEIMQVRRAQDRQAQRLLDRNMQLKLTERVAVAVEREHQRTNERDMLGEVIDGIAPGGDASLP